jgi:hypothetical protein
MSGLLVYSKDGLSCRRGVRHDFSYRSFNSNQFHDPTCDIPVLNVEVPFGIPVRSVGPAEDAFDPLVLGNVEVGPFGRIGVMT